MPLHCASCGADRTQNPHVRAAAAQVAIQSGGDLRIARVALAPEQRHRRDDEDYGHDNQEFDRREASLMPLCC